MKRRSTSFACFLLLLMACEHPVAPAPEPVVAPVVGVAKLVKIAGQVSLTRNAITRPAETGPVFEGDFVETQANGHAVLSVGGLEVELLRLSRFRVGASLTDLGLSMGELMFEDADGGTYVTPAGTVRSVRRTRVSVQLQDGGVAFAVTMGTLELVDVDADAGVARVQAGERFVAYIGKLTIEDDPGPEAPQASNAQLEVVPRGAVMVASPAHPRRRLSAEGAALSELTSFWVESGSRLHAERGAAQVDFNALAKGTLNPAAADRVLETALTHGEARVFLAAGEAMRLAGKKAVFIRAKQATTLWATAGKDGTKLEVIGGSVDMAAEGALPRNVGSSETALVSSRGLATRSRAAPATSLPAGRVSRVFWRQASEVELQFPAGDALMEVARDPGFTDVLVVTQGSAGLRVPAPLSGALYWRRRGSAESSVAHFSRDDEGGRATAKTDTVAETGLKATVFFQSAVPTLTFTFSPQANAVAWRFRVYDDTNFKVPLIDRKLTENRAVVETGVLKEGGYVWSAVALDGRGVEAPGGRMNKMEIVFDNSVTRLMIQSPKEGERSALATGLAPKGSRLFLNGAAVATDASGRFSAATQGASVLVFRLVTAGGQESQWVRRASK